MSTLTGENLRSATSSFMRLAPIGAEYVQDPYPLFDCLLEAGPIKSDVGPWIVGNYTDIGPLARGTALSRADIEARFYGLTMDSPMVRLTAPGMIFRNPPDHTRLRGLVSKAFTPRGVSSWEVVIGDLVDDLLDGFEPGQEIDVLHQFAVEVPMRVICQLLGIPLGFHEGSMRYTDALVKVLEPGDKSQEVWDECDAVALESFEQVAGYVRERRANLGDDLLSALIIAGEGDDRLDEDEIVAQVVNLHIAGYETTSNLIANTLLTLLRNPQQLALLKDDPSLLPSTVEEGLRYESPARTVLAQVAGRDLDVRGTIIPEGDPVILLLAAANRDPSVFSDPHLFDIRRDPNPHLAFSIGYHFCIGAHLARLETSIALGKLVERFPDVRLASDDVRWRSSWTLRALEGLPVVL